MSSRADGVFRDYARNAAVSERSGLLALASTVPTVRFIAVTLFRLAQTVSCIPPLASLVKQLNHVVTGADIAWQAEIGPGMVLFHPTGVVIGPYARLGANCIIQQGVTVGGTGTEVRDQSASSPVIGDGVALGAGARVFGPVHIGDHATIGANAVVISDVPACAVAVGVPARILEKKPNNRTSSSEIVSSLASTGKRRDSGEG